MTVWPEGVRKGFLNVRGITSVGRLDLMLILLPPHTRVCGTQTNTVGSQFDLIEADSLCSLERNEILATDSLREKANFTREE